MRISLLGGLMLGLILPLITLPLNWHLILPGANSIDKPLNTTLLSFDSKVPHQKLGNFTPEQSQLSFGKILWFGLGIFYVSIAIYRFIQLNNKLLYIRRSIRKNPKEKKDGYWFIQLDTPSPAFSFFNYIFISNKLENMSDEEIDRIARHEVIHAKQYHTADILFFEVISIIFWFNPLINILKNYLQEVHEFLADEKILNNKTMKRSYSNLLLKLTSAENPPILSSAFSAKQISRRLRMIEKPKSLPRHRILFFLLLPVFTLLLMSFSYLETRSNKSTLSIDPQSDITKLSSQVKVGKISWEGNSLFTDSQLTKELGIKTGHAYSEDHLIDRLYKDADAVNTLYLDKGYLFLSLEYAEEPKDNGTMDLTITIYEGEPFRIGQIIIKGNGSIPEQDVMDVILLKPGDLFSKTRLIQSVHAIQQMNKFVPEEILPNPIPLKDPVSGESSSVVDIEFLLKEK